MLHFLHKLLPSTYSEEVVLGLDGIDPTLLPKLDEPFDFSYDSPHEVVDGDIIEIYMEAADDDDFDDDVLTEVSHQTSYGRKANPTLDDFLTAVEII